MGMGELGFNFKVVLFVWGFLFNLFSLSYCSVIFEITSSTPLLPGKNLNSPSQNFELGFFSPNNSHFHYVGLWFKEVLPRTYVWVANRENPITNSSASLTIGSDGNLWLLDGQKKVIWSRNVSNPLNDSFGSISDDGLFALRSRKTRNQLWNCFLDPTDSLLPRTRFVFSETNGHLPTFQSWKSANDPSPGDFTANIPPRSPPQIVIWKGSKPHFRTGPWDKTKFIGVPEMHTNYDSGLQLGGGDSQQSIVFSFPPLFKYARFTLFPNGVARFLCWNTGKIGWFSIWEGPLTPCAIYGACGPFGVCQRNEPNLSCRCLKGFVPKSNEEWSKGNWSGGCVRQTELNCGRNTSSTNTLAGNSDGFLNISGRNISTTNTLAGNSDGFLNISGLMLPDSYESFGDWDANECRQLCLNNCSCSGYAFVSGIGCLVWGGNLVDVHEQSGGQDLFLRVAHSELIDDGGGRKTKSKIKVRSILALVSAIVAAFIIAAMIYSFWKWRAQKRVMINDQIDASRDILSLADQIDASRDKSGAIVWKNPSEDKDSAELPMFDFDSILVATNNFDIQNKLGQGGYGPVYKGKLPDGKDVAIKRLSSSSGQGLEEFKNEVKLISKLKHRNLVRLIGCCIEREEKILIYEYMPNKSLDTYLFDAAKKAKLDWKTRMNIIVGVARGLLYLHRDSCLRVIHRDLKVSNILLDEKMNPKISDFGLARIFEGTQDLGSTRRVVGTLGYMAPEYMLGGVFSEKSDVFGFGVLVLEIVSGRKVNSFQNNNQHLSLVAYAWECWCKNSGIDMADQALGKSFSKSNTSRCVNIGLLCVQDNAADRPTMTAIVSMLSGEKAKLPQPKQPAFAFQNVSTNSTFSQNYITESTIEPR